MRLTSLLTAPLVLGMATRDWILLVVTLACAIVASLLAAADAAVQSFSRSRAERLVAQGVTGAERVRSMTEDPAPYLNATMFVRTVLEILTVVTAALVVFEHVEPTWQRLLITVGSMVVVSFILWGVAPRTLGRQRADTWAVRMARPMSLLATILGPIPQLMILLGNALTPGRGFSDGPFSSEAELREMVDIAEASDLIEADESKMLHSVFELSDTLLKEVMVPRTDVVFINRTKTLRQAMSLALRSGFSRIPVVGDGGLDDVLGVLYLKDVMRRTFDNHEAQTHEQVEKVMRPATFCPDSKPVDDVLREMQLSRSHLVMVVDEFGGTAGLATIEDILEEIVGEITDEYDAEPTLTEEVEPGTHRVSARMPVDDLGDLFGLKVDDDEVATVGGLMAKVLSVVPIPGSQVTWEGLEITAETVAGRRHVIDTCLVRRAPEPDPDDSEATDAD